MKLEEIDFSNPGQPIAVPKSTLVSIVPFAISEEKPGLIPGTFNIPASVDGKPECLIIGDSIHYVYIDRERGSLRVINPSYVVAKAIVNDFNGAQIQAAPNSHPGLFWLVGEWTPERVESEAIKQLEAARQVQYNWFVSIVKLADDDYEKTRTHYSVSDTQRTAARFLDPKNTRGRQWLMPTSKELDKLDICPACGSELPKGVAICRFCRAIIDPNKFKSYNFDLGEIFKK